MMIYSLISVLQELVEDAGTSLARTEFNNLISFKFFYEHRYDANCKKIKEYWIERNVGTPNK